MAYSTDYEIAIQPDDLDNIDLDYIKFNLEKISEYPFELDEDDEFTLHCNEVTWYEYNVHMRQLSRLFPTVLFTVSGEGEEQGDVWRQYYKDGKSQNANMRIEYIVDDFDESKLI